MCPSVKLVRLDPIPLVARPDVSVGVRRLPIPFPAVWALITGLLAALVPVMRHHVRLLAKGAVALGTVVPLDRVRLRHHPQLPRVA